MLLKSKKTDAERAAEKINRAAEKYGPEFRKDLELLKTKPFWTIVTVGQKYGITKERVRQFFKIAYGEPVSKYRKEKRARIKADIELLETSCNMYHYASKSSTGMVRAFEKCVELGF